MGLAKLACFGLFSILYPREIKSHRTPKTFFFSRLPSKLREVPHPERYA